MPAVIWTFEGDTADLERAMASVGVKVGDTEKGLTDLEKDGKKSFKDGLEIPAKKAAKVIGGVLIAATVAATAAAVGLSKAVMTTANDLDNLAKQARRAGTTAQELDTIRGVFDLAGVSISQTDAMMKKFRVNIGKAAQETAAQVDALADLGLEAKDLVGIPLDRKLALVARGMEDIDDEGRRAAIATDLFGRSGLDILPVLEEGEDAVARYAESIEEAGVVSNRWAKDSEDLVDQIALTKRTMIAMRNEALAPLIPAFSGIIEAVRETMLEFKDTDALEDFGQVAVDVLLGVVAPGAVILAGEMRKAMGGISASIEAVVITLGLLEAGFLVVTGRMKKAWAQTDENQEAIDRYNQSIRDLGATQVDTAAAVESLLGRLDLLRGRLGAARAEAARSTGLAGALDEVGDAGGVAAEGVEDLVGWLEELDGVGMDLGGLDFLSDPDLQMDLGDLFAEEVLSGLERAEEGFQAFKDVWNEGLGEIVNAVGELAIDIVDTFADMAGEVMDERIDAHERTSDRLASINRQLNDTVDAQERERLLAEKARLQERSAAEREAALEAFRTQKALAIVSASINTALAIINAFATAPNIILGAVMAVVAGAAGAVAIAKIASQQPPSFHKGGVLRAADIPRATSIDRIPVSMKAGEGALNTAGVAAAGGPAGVDALNSGAALGGGMSVNLIRVGTRTTEAISHQQLRPRTGRMAQEFRSVRPKVGRSFVGRR